MDDGGEFEGSSEGEGIFKEEKGENDPLGNALMDQ